MNTQFHLDDEPNSYVTTFDNEHDFITDYKGWHNFDVNHGYNTEQILANIMNALGYSIELPVSFQNEIANRAIDLMVEMRPGLWKRVTSEG